MKIYLLLIVLSMGLLSSCRYSSARSGGTSTVIYIQPFYPFSMVRARETAAVVESFYHCRVVILPETAIYAAAKSRSGRYSAPVLLSIMEQQMSGKEGKMIALTSSDIFCESRGVKEWGIFGLGDRPGHACVVSDFRLKWFPARTKDFTINVALHELGHTFGLPHCSYDQRCLMNDSKGGIKELYTEKRMLCPHCAKQIGLCS
jgi:archaemetzincin